MSMCDNIKGIVEGIIELRVRLQNLKKFELTEEEGLVVNDSIRVLDNCYRELFEHMHTMAYMNWVVEAITKEKEGS